MYTIKQLLALEQDYRKAGKWFIFSGLVQNDSGKLVFVDIKSHGFYNQILRLENSPVNECSGHTIDKAMKMKKFLKDKINGVAITI